MATQAEFFGTQEPGIIGEGKTVNLKPNEFFGDKAELKIHDPVDQDEKLNFAQRFGRDIAKRAAVDAEIKRTYDEGEIGTAEALLQTIGKTGFGSVLDFLGETIISAGRGLSAITPDIIERPLIDGAVAAGHFLLNTDIGQEGLNAAKSGAAAWSRFKISNPRAALNIEAVVNIGVLLAPVKGGTRVSPPTALGRAGAALETKAVTQTTAKRGDFINDLVMPKQTSAVRTEQVARTEETGLFRQKQVKPSKSEQNTSVEVGKIPAVGSSKTLQRNHNAISNEVTKEANTLKSVLAEKEVIFPRKELNSKLDEALARLDENPLIVGDASKTAEKIVGKAKEILSAKPSNGSSLLAARKELDSWIKSQKGPGVFDPNLESAITIAVREVRTALNDFLASKATSTAVKASLKKQSTLLRAMENIAPKAADEGGNIVVRAWQNAMRVLPFRGEFNQIMATAFGIGGLGASAMFAPYFTKIVIGTIASYALGKAVMSSPVKSALSLLLKEMDKAIRLAKDKSLITSMKLDRALIVELIEMSEILETKEKSTQRTISSDEEFDELPSGSEFIDPEGNPRKKP